MGRINPFKVTFEDREYTFDGKMTISEAMLLQEKGHCTPLTVFPAIDALEPRAVQAFMFIVKRRNKELVEFDSLADSDIYSLNIELLPSEEPGEEAGEVSEVDPPGPTGGKTRKAGISKTG